MTATEQTRQQLDPGGTTGLRAVTIVLSAGALAFATIMTFLGHAEISNPVLAALALVALATACLVLVASSSPYRGPLTWRTHLFSHLAALSAIALEAAAQWGTDIHLGDDWGPICLGIILVALGPYRPARELALSGVFSAILIGALTFAEANDIPARPPWLAVVALAVTPMLALCFAAATFSHGIVASILLWQRRASDASTSLVEELKDGIARSVQHDRVTILNHDVLPFFTTVLSSDEITDADRARAHDIADAIRRVMVEEVDRSWLENVIELAGGSGQRSTAVSTVIVDDRMRLAPMMATAQRTAVRALLVAILDIPNFDRGDLRIVLSAAGRECICVVNAQLDLAENVMRSTLAPYFAVMRSVFIDVEVDFMQPTLRLKFSYEHQ